MAGDRLHDLREAIGLPEDIVICGPRRSGKTTIALAMAQYHVVVRKKRTFMVDEQIFEDGTYDKHPHYIAAEVVIWVGCIPKNGRPYRVITTSEIF